jgi:hypothetical protein
LCANNQGVFFINKQEQRAEHYKKYKNLPVEQMPNFGLKRPLTASELEELKLVAMYECKSNPENWLRSIVLTGNVEGFLKKAQEARKTGFYECLKDEIIDGRITDTVSYLMPFPPVRER